MAYGDRDYFRERPSGTNPLMWLLTGTLPLFRFAGIQVKAHAAMVLFLALILLGGMPGYGGSSWQDRILGPTILFLIVLLHEFGHCFTSRWVGGSANEIIMHPLGGLALCQPPRRPWPTFLTVAGGPMVNVIICLLAAIVCVSTIGRIPLVPFFLSTGSENNPFLFSEIGRFAFWVFNISWSLLLFNLIPVYPLDGGQMLQTALWPKFGYHKATYFSATVGLVASVVVIIFGIAFLQFFMVILGVMGAFYCYQIRQQMLATWPEPWADSLEEDYSASFAKQKKVIDKDAKRLAQLEADERAERESVDRILAKVSAKGMNSLSWGEKRALKKASEHQRQRDTEIRQRRRN